MHVSSYLRAAVVVASRILGSEAANCHAKRGDTITLLEENQLV